MTTKKHDWLMALDEGDNIQVDQMRVEWGLDPAIGWVEDGAFVLAVFLDHGLPQQANGRSRVPIGKAGCWSAKLAAISKQAVPIFGQEGEAWIYHGFFRFEQPAGLSVDCIKVDKHLRHYVLDT